MKSRVLPNPPNVEILILSDETLWFREQLTLEMHSGHPTSASLVYWLLDNQKHIHLSWLSWAFSFLPTHQLILESLEHNINALLLKSSLTFKHHKHAIKMQWMLWGTVLKKRHFYPPRCLLSSISALSHLFPSKRQLFMHLFWLSEVKASGHCNELSARFFTWLLCPELRKAFLEFDKQKDLMTKTFILRLLCVCYLFIFFNAFSNRY